MKEQRKVLRPHSRERKDANQEEPYLQGCKAGRMKQEKQPGRRTTERCCCWPDRTNLHSPKGNGVAMSDEGEKREDFLSATKRERRDSTTKLVTNQSEIKWKCKRAVKANCYEIEWRMHQVIDAGGPRRNREDGHQKTSFALRGDTEEYRQSTEVELNRARNTLQN